MIHFKILDQEPSFGHALLISLGRLISFLGNLTSVGCSLEFRTHWISVPLRQVWFQRECETQSFDLLGTRPSSVQ